MRTKITALLWGLALLSPLSPLSALDLDLAGYMALVEENSKTLHQADIDRELARAQEMLTRSAALPGISATAGYTRNLTEITQPYPAYVVETGTPGTVLPLQTQDVKVNQKNDFSFDVGVQQLLFDVTVFRALEASRRYRVLTGTIYEATRQGVLTAAKQVYYQTVLLNEVYEVRAATEQNAYEAYQDVLQKFENGVASELEALQAEVSWQLNIPQTTLAARNRDMALSNLKFLAGLEPEDEVVLQDTLSAVPEQNTEMALGEILASRPDYQAIQGQIELRDINVSAVRAEFYPSLSATFGYGWQKSDDEFRFDDGTDAMQFGLSLTVPIFYGGSRFAKMQQARSELERARIDLLQKQDEIRTEINNLRMSLDEAASRIISAESTVKTAEKAYRITEISYENGLGTQLDLKDARLNQQNAQLGYYSAIFDYMNAYFSWQQAVGEGDKLPF